MIGRTKSVILTACAGALVLGVSGCTASADPLPSTSPPTASASQPSQSATASAKPTPTPVPASSKGPAQNWPVPEMPEAAKEKSEAGIRAFALYYYEVVEYTIQTNDTGPIKKLTKRSCVECGESLIDPFDDNKKVGSWISGADFDVVVTKTILQPKNGIALYTTAQGEMALFMSDGTLQGKFPATPKPAPMTMLLQFEDGWKVESMEYLDENT